MNPIAIQTNAKRIRITANKIILHKKRINLFAITNAKKLKVRSASMYMLTITGSFSATLTIAGIIIFPQFSVMHSAPITAGYNYIGIKSASHFLQDFHKLMIHSVETTVIITFTVETLND
jgi:hypothetical protein